MPKTLGSIPSTIINKLTNKSRKGYLFKKERDLKKEREKPWVEDIIEFGKPSDS